MDNPQKIMIAGIGTEVGKTLTAAIFTMLLQGDYWKPVECGEESDSKVMRNYLNPEKHTIFPPRYSLKAPLSPHHAARLENQTLLPDSIVPPFTKRPLVIEGVGGINVPLTNTISSLEVFSQFKGPWVVVSRHYLGSINHTLNTLEVLARRGIVVLGLIFNGLPNVDSEKAIQTLSSLPLLGRLVPEKQITHNTIERYAEKWQPTVTKHLAKIQKAH